MIRDYEWSTCDYWIEITPWDVVIFPGYFGESNFNFVMFVYSRGYRQQALENSFLTLILVVSWLH